MWQWQCGSDNVAVAVSTVAVYNTNHGYSNLKKITKISQKSQIFFKISQKSQKNPKNTTKKFTKIPQPPPYLPQYATKSAHFCLHSHSHPRSPFPN
jgi:hypothetical protein